jgi:hypothetical protein
MQSRVMAAHQIGRDIEWCKRSIAQIDAITGRASLYILASPLNQRGDSSCCFDTDGHGFSVADESARWDFIERVWERMKPLLKEELEFTLTVLRQRLSDL